MTIINIGHIINSYKTYQDSRKYKPYEKQSFQLYQDGEQRKDNLMSKIVKNVTELIGNTPLLEASKYAEAAQASSAHILVKLEYLNPAGSVKDRVALSMIEDAEKSNELKPGATIIEPTSGNTGIGLAAVATAKGYKAILTLPDYLPQCRDFL